MDGQRLDNLARAVAAGSRRRLLQKLTVGAVLGPLASRLGLGVARADGRDDAACAGKRPCHAPYEGACICDKCAADYSCYCARAAKGGTRCVDQQSFTGIPNRRERCRTDKDCRAGASCIDHEGCAWDLSKNNPTLRWQRYCVANCRR
jgi:hypothetical protein